MKQHHGQRPFPGASARPVPGTAVRLWAAALGLALSGNPAANPTGPEVAHGAASFVTPDPATLSVHASPGTIINWRSFGIAPGELTEFVQRSAASAVLNRVTGTDPSAILGALHSNGRVFLINANGIVFGRDAVVDTAGFVAATLDITDADFLAGRLEFAGDGAPIENYGLIRAAGDVALIAPNIGNHGTVRVEDGNLILAAGRRVTLTDLASDGVQFEVAAPHDEIVNLGRLLAGNGAVGLFGANLRNAGVIQAEHIGRDADGNVVLRAGGDIELAAGSTTTADGERGGRVSVAAGATTWVAGEVSARGAAGGGGAVHLLGERVAVVDGARVDASGTSGGGEVLVGGDYQGGGNAQRAWLSYVGSGAELRADATVAGDGGRVIVWADHTTRSHGRISARGGPGGGDGGLVETSGKVHLDVTRAPDVAAPHGDGGDWLLDPGNLEVVAGAGLLNAIDADLGPSASLTPSASPSQVGADLIGTVLALGGTNVTLDTTNAGLAEAGDITVSAPIVVAGSAQTSSLFLLAHGDVNVDANIDASGFANGVIMQLLADWNGQDGVGVLSLAPGVSIDTGGEQLVLAGNDLRFDASNAVLSGGGAVQLAAILPATAISIGGSAAFDVSLAELSAIDTGGATLTVGPLSGTATLSVDSALASGALNAGGLVLRHDSVAVNAPIDFGPEGETLRFEAARVDLAADLDTGASTIDASVSTLAVVADATIASPIDIDTLLLLDPAVTATLGGVTSTQNFTWAAGTLSGAGGSLSTQTASSIDGAADHVLDNLTWDNAGVANWNGGDIVIDGASGLLANNSDGSFIVPAASGAGVIRGSGGGAFDNDGSFSMNLPGTVSVQVPHTNTGSLLVNAGDLAFDAGVVNASGISLLGGATLTLNGATTHTGSLVVPAGATLTLGAGGSLVTNANTSVSGDVNVNGGSLDVAGGTFAAATTKLEGGNLTFSAAGSTSTLALISGTLDEAQNAGIVSFAWDGGTVSGTGIFSPANATLGGGAHTLAGLTWQNNSIVTWNAGDLLLADALAVVENAPSTGSFDVRVAGPTLVSGAGRFDNDSQFAMNGTGTLRFDVPFTNTDSTNVLAGTLAFDRPITTTSFLRALGGTLELNAAVNNTDTLDVRPGATLSIGPGGALTTGPDTLINGNVRVDGGTLDVVNPASYAATSMRIDNGGIVTFTDPGTSLSLDLVSGVLDEAQNLGLTGAFNWEGGTLSGSGGSFTTTGAATLSGAQHTLSGIGWNANGGVDWAGGGLLLADAAALLTVAAASTVDVTTPSGEGLSGAGAVVNNGTFNLNSASGHDLAVAFTNNNSLGLNAGLTSFNAALVNSAGASLDLASGASVAFNGPLTHAGGLSLPAGAALSLGPGNTLTTTASTSLLGDVQVTGTATLSVNAGTYAATDTRLDPLASAAFNIAATTANLQLGGTLNGADNLTLTGAFNWSGGALRGTGGTFTTPAATVVTGAGHTLDALTWLNTGTADWGGIDLLGTGSLRNAGALTFTGPAGRTVAPGVTNDGSLGLTGGTLRFTGALSNGPTGDLDIGANTALEAVQGLAHSGGLSLARDATLTLGAATDVITTAATTVNGRLVLNGGALTVGAGTFAAQDISLAGGAALTFASAASSETLLLGAGTLDGAQNLSLTGDFFWDGGTLAGSGTFQTGANSEVRTTAAHTLSGLTWRNTGDAKWRDGDIVFADSAAGIDNAAGGLFDAVVAGAASSIDGSGSFTNAGTFTMGAASAVTLNAAFANAGRVNVDAGTLLFAGGYRQSAGTLSLRGGAVGGDPPLELLAGTLEGSGSVLADVDAPGATISPGTSPGTVLVDGDLTLGEAARLDLELGGLGDTEHDVLIVTGELRLAGGVRISLIDSYSGGAIGDSYRPIRFGTASGRFASVEQPPGFRYEFVPEEGGLRLITTLVPGTSLDDVDQVLVLRAQGDLERASDRNRPSDLVALTETEQAEREAFEKLALCR